MINKLFGGFGAARLDDERPDVRLRALARLDPVVAEDAAALQALAAQDPDAGVRAAAVAMITDAPALLALMEDSPSSVAAARRLGDLIGAGLDVLALADASGNPATVRLLLDAVTAPEHWQALLGRVRDEELLGEIAARHALAPVRMAAAQRLQDEPILRRVEKLARGKDKAVLQHVRDALEARRDVRSGLAATRQRIDTLAGELDTLARAEDDPQLVERVQWLGAQLQQTAQQRGELLERAAALQVDAPLDAADGWEQASALQQQLAARIESAAAEQQRQEAVLRERRQRMQQAGQALEALTAAVDRARAGLGENDHAPEAVAAALEAALAEQAASFDALAIDAAELRRSFEARLSTGQTLAAALRRLAALGGAGSTPPQAPDKRLRWLERRLGELAWPADLPEPPILADLRAQHEQAAAALRNAATEREQVLAAVEALCAQVDGALDEGHLKAAIGFAAQARQQLDALPGGVPPAAVARLARASARIDELGDWQKFATQPKRAELCEQMEALIGTATAPEALAEQIKALREAWNALGPARDAAGRKLVARFNDAAREAFEPCRKAFEAQRQQRAFNLENREQICAELETFEADYSWATPDWKAVDRIVREASQQWHRYADVEPVANRRVGRRYHAVVTRLRERLDARRAENLAMREALVARARELAASDDLAAAAEEAKSLQRRWQDADIMPRGADRKLWKAFRSACDAIFAGLQDQRQAQRSASDAALHALQRRIEALEAPLQPLTTATLRDREAPEGVAAELGSVEQALTELRRDRALPGGRLDGLEGRLKALRGLLRDLKRDAPWRDALLAAETALSEPPAAQGDDPEAGEALREACVDLELLAGVESPEADAGLRMQRQVQRLAAGMRGELDADSEALAELLVRLREHASRVSPTVSAPLFERARAAVAALLGG